MQRIFFQICLLDTPSSTMHPKSNLMQMFIKSPSECSDSEIIGFKGMVLQGRQVSERGLGDLIKQAVFLAFRYESEKLVGVAALKKPRNGYNSRFSKMLVLLNGLMILTWKSVGPSP